jgi:diguanylate cyclase (GGDEF)-like protein/PAS domain S-box-containing protein/putative nucleotidyltransferase with HDIG domain
MKRLRISVQIALSLAMLSGTVLLLTKPLGLLPDHRREAVRTRIAVCENLAVASSLLTSQQQWEAIGVCLRELKARSEDVVSVGLRRQDGRVVAQAGDHQNSWKDTPDGRSSETHFYVPILQGRARWGSLEVEFLPPGTPGWPSWFDPAEWRLIAFIAAANALIFICYLRRVLYDLDPSRVMPQRVRSALDALTEGLLVLDNEGRIVMANHAFAAALGRTPENLLGTQASILPWKETGESQPRPWDEVRKSKDVCSGVEMALQDGTAAPRTFLVNAAPIEDAQGQPRGVLASFADITQLEQKKQELLKMLEALRDSRDKIRQQNEELSFLATRDSLTGCLNRRSFFEQFERLWRQGNQFELCCVMADVDKFKSINDTFGHSTGDEVLRGVARVLLESIGEAGLVCRYGGEEFCIVLANCSSEHAPEVAEILRGKIAALEFPQLVVTASFGVSSGVFGATSIQELLDQADKSLYYSKNTGRNRVSRWDQLPADFESYKKDERNAPPAASVLSKNEPAVPYHAVASLMCALAYRDPDTACHSARVADLSVATARGLMSAGEAYLLEIGALLHDIGKIGVPDAILLKPGPLTPDEWEIMQLHGRIGVEIVNASFRAVTLVDIVRFHHAKFGSVEPGMPMGKEIPLGARIVCIADAYDAMVSDRVYRKGRTPEAAFAELRRMGGTQFDPELVERFIDTVSSRSLVSSCQPGPLSKDLALNLGLQTERLATALDDRDYKTIQAMAMHLKSTAEAHGLKPLAEAADLLQECEGDSDLPQMVNVIHQIIDLSLSAQQAYLTINSDMAQVAMARAQFPTTPDPGNSPAVAS